MTTDQIDKLAPPYSTLRTHMTMALQSTDQSGSAGLIIGMLNSLVEGTKEKLDFYLSVLEELSSLVDQKPQITEAILSDAASLSGELQNPEERIKYCKKFIHFIPTSAGGQLNNPALGFCKDETLFHFIIHDANAGLAAKVNGGIVPATWQEIIPVTHSLCPFIKAALAMSNMKPAEQVWTAYKRVGIEIGRSDLNFKDRIFLFQTLLEAQPEKSTIAHLIIDSAPTAISCAKDLQQAPTTLKLDKLIQVLRMPAINNELRNVLLIIAASKCSDLKFEGTRKDYCDQFAKQITDHSSGKPRNHLFDIKQGISIFDVIKSSTANITPQTKPTGSQRPDQINADKIKLGFLP